MPEHQVVDARGTRTTRVLITSLDGNITHPFRTNQTVGDVHDFGYDRLVRQKEQIPFDRTWIEYNDQRQEDSIVLSTLVDGGDKHSNSGGQAGGNNSDRPEPDLTLALVWDTGGGCR